MRKKRVVQAGKCYHLVSRVALSDAQQAKAVNLILEWIRRQAKTRAIVAEWDC